MKKRLSIFGCTGSIGETTLKLIKKENKEYSFYISMGKPWLQKQKKKLLGKRDFLKSQFLFLCNIGVKKRRLKNKSNSKQPL